MTSKEYLYRIATPSLAKVPGWFFYALKHYFKFANTNVSNARMNIPKAIRSLKSNGFLSISTTPILCRIEVSHPATRLFLSIYYHKRRQRTISISVSPGTLALPRSGRSTGSLLSWSSFFCKPAGSPFLPLDRDTIHGSSSNILVARRSAVHSLI